ncbi:MULTISPECIES: type I restriction endonuclease subunit R [unclassified Pseudoalteromonas]|uniref:type I restriction endonuclease subunit R n=1 Tax=unclassified Pseudoalteromonas TaxID=194690 RepID=UPI002359E2C9|nr:MULTISPECIES: HsdR family type I site-specific deoxyribonuclease [unclassified Pseudoalteromonas]MDC9563303.1 HsdR family type I site-specific deoxyribonuclease [Pseudoalteromonas sp. GAB2316C]MDC9567682.1 HsdR family type I site-specific deoxyribonuclease [Pseudoalteromonas sp. GABNB9D]MDC9571959.1 HsdR family type I site-specific deoxyribonuclease [Pseudoalteromonas sp. GABNS16A]MDC9576368.1 HsdR family type I site-specific deoxyribonuclease [Pseudoalteromonas sp. GABNS16E]MDC9583750.1 Hs
MTVSVNFQEEFSAKIPALTLLTNLGYTFIPPSECEALRGNTLAGNKKSTHQVILLPVMRAFLANQTFSFAGKQHTLSEAAIDKVMHELNPAMNLGLKAANEKIYDALMYGVSVTEFIDGKKASPTIKLIDWHNIDNNAFHCTEELVVQNAEGTGNRRPDIVCFVNGLPLVVIEAKRPDSNKEGKSTNFEAISQHIRNQKQDEIPHLYAYSQLLLAINGHEGLYATCGTPEKFWAKWKEEHSYLGIPEAEFVRLKNHTLRDAQLNALFNHRPAKDKADYQSLIAAGELTVTDQDRLIASLLRPERLLDMTRLFTLFDKKAGKIVARYQQVFGIKALIERINTFDDSGSREGGVIWHTTGSGKSFTMVFLSKALIWLEELAQCRFIIVTDRVDLEDQLSRTFTSGGALDDQDKVSAMATTGKRLAEQIGKGNERVIFSIINKFGSAIKYKECYNDSPNIIVLVDEGHRSQNGENNIRMQQTLPKAAFIAFTGTPLLKDDKTENKFGKIIHSYTMQQAVEDKTVTPLLYEERIPELNVNDKAIDAWFDRSTSKLSDKQKTDLKRKFSQKGQIYQTADRIMLIAYDIADHFQNFKHQGLKGQLACDSKASAIRYKEALDKIGTVTSVVAMSAPDTREGHDVVDQESKDIVQNWWKANVDKMDEKAYTKAIIEDFGRDDGPDIMIVVDKLLTGFDEPKNTVLYIDKPLKEHNLIQAIARVNRLHSKKQFGYLIDYRGILKELDTTIEKYQDLAERTQGGFDIDDLKGLYNRMDTEYKKLPGLHSDLWAIFDGVKNKQDGPALRQALAPKVHEVDGKLTDTNLKKRDDFYSILTAFSNCMKVALQSATYFEDKSFDNKRDLYKRDLKAFVDLRKQVREDADETINYDEYAEDIRSLLDKHIAGIEVKEPDGAYLVGNLGKDVKPQDMSDDEARNQTDKITGRITKMIEQDLADDPYAQEYFSKMLKKAIEDAKAMFDAPVKQYILFADFEQEVKDRKVADVPNDFMDDAGKLNKHAQAYFGLFKHLFDSALLTEKALDNEKLVALAFDIDAVVNDAVAEYSINPAEIENAIHMKLLPILFAELGLDNAQKLIEEVLKITRLGIARG